jgi:geranylgeranyl diphosphate synthase type II
MDDSDLRRGKPSIHKVFGEAIAISAGDALLTLAFQVMTDLSLFNGYKPTAILKAVHIIAKAAGLEGMIGGQTVDIETQGDTFDLPLLEYIHTHKTGALILGAIKAGAILGDAGEEELEALTKYGKMVGLTFQIIDDILDIEGTKKELGKSTGLDMVQDKATYPRLLGLEEARKRAKELTEQAEKTLDIFNHQKAEPLRQIARYICERIQ